MRILGVDSTATAASCAVYEDGKIRSLIYSNTGLTHSQTLLPMVDDALKKAGIAIDDIDLFAVSNGPGSFTGVRIGVSAVKGLAQPLNKKCITVSTLETIAKPLQNTGCYAVAVMDARCNQVYTAQFDCEGGFKRVTEDEAINIDELTGKLSSVNKQVVLIGDGADVTYKKMVDVIPSVKKAVPSICYQSAADVTLIAAEKIANNEDNEQIAKDILPNYLRLSQAERELKKKKINNN